MLWLTFVSNFLMNVTITDTEKNYELNANSSHAQGASFEVAHFTEADPAALSYSIHL
jgi:hypothetical protein